jgi:UDP-glucose:(heptosyl)LPS alpha-1,3-glucosyltransferase
MAIVLLKPGAKRGGGLEKASSLIASRFAKTGREVTLLTSGDLHLEIDGVKSQTISPLSSISLLNLLSFERATKKWLSHHPATIVFGFDRHSYQTHCRAGNGVHAAYLERRKKLEGFWKGLSFRTNPYHQLLLKIEKRGFENPNLKKLFVNSHMVKQEVLHHYKVDPKKIIVVPNGIDWKGLEVPFNQGFEEKVSLSSPIQLLFIGHEYRRKGLKELLYALSLLQSEDWHLSVVGRDRNEWIYRKMADRLGLGEHVTFFGPQKEILPYYQLADFVVIPSLYDPFANVTVEALGMGVKVISSTQNGGYEILKEPFGFVVPHVDNPDNFAAVLKKAFSTGKKTHSQALQIREMASSFDLSQTIDRIVEETLTDAS